MDYNRNNIKKECISYRNGINEINEDIKMISCEEKAYYRGLTFKIRLSSRGKGTIVFNTSLAKVYTIAVVNQDKHNLEGYLEISPDGMHYMRDESDSKIIETKKMQIFIGAIFTKYTALVLEGSPYMEATVLFQTQSQ